MARSLAHRKCVHRPLTKTVRYPPPPWVEVWGCGAGENGVGGGGSRAWMCRWCTHVAGNPAREQFEAHQLHDQIALCDIRQAPPGSAVPAHWTRLQYGDVRLALAQLTLACAVSAASGCTLTVRWRSLGVRKRVHPWGARAADFGVDPYMARADPYLSSGQSRLPHTQ